MHGKELRRLRIAVNMSERMLADRMGWYKKKIQRFEKSYQFCLHSAEMQKLLTILDAR